MLNRILICAFCSMLPLSQAGAALVTWTGDENTSFHEELNWEPMVVPGGGDEARFTGGNVSFSGGAGTALATVVSNTDFFLNGFTYDTDLLVEGIRFNVSNGTITGGYHDFTGHAVVGIEGVALETTLDLAVVDSARVTFDNSTVQATNAVIGFDSLGTAIVTLIDSTLTVTSPTGIEIGQGANGVLNVTNASTLVTPKLTLASTLTSSAEVLVANDSTMHLTSALILGKTGDDILDVEDGSTVSAPTLTIGEDGFGSLSLFDADTSFTVGGGDIGIGVNADGGGRLQLGGGVSFATPANLYVGVAGGGSLRTDGGTLTVNGDLVFGVEAGSHGNWDLDDEGAPTTVSVSGDLIVGHSGRGEIAAEKEEDAISITADEFVIGRSGNEFSAAVFDNFHSGTMSFRTSTVGDGGNGTLLLNGGVWHTADLTTIARDRAAALSLFDVSATTEDLGIAINAGSMAEVEIFGSGMSWTVADDAVIADAGLALVLIGSAATFNSARGIIARSGGSSGTVYVQDMDTRFNVGNLEVAGAGTGVLEVTFGAGATTLQTDVANGGGAGSILVDGENSFMTVTTWFRLSAAGEGRLSVRNGGRLLTDQAILEFGGAEVTFNAWISGPGSYLSANDLRLGFDSATGAMLIDDQGRVDCGLCTIGENPAAVSQLVVDGAGAEFNSFDRLAIASFGRGALDVVNGASAAAHTIDIGTAGGFGRLAADGPGSAITATTDLVLSAFGFGELHVKAGGSVEVDTAIVDYAGIIPFFNVLVDGADSYFRANAFRLGADSVSAAMLVSDGGRADCFGPCTIGENPGGFASARITDDTSVWNAFADLNIGNDETAGGAGGSALLQVWDQGFVSVIGSTNVFNSGPGDFGELEIIGGNLTTTSFWNRGLLDFRDGILTVVGGTFDNGTPQFVLDGTDPFDLPLLRLTDGASSVGLTAAVTVGADRSGRLEVLGDSVLESEGGVIGANATGSGTAIIDGENSLWDAGSEALTVGDAGGAEMHVRAGGEVHSDGGFIARQPGSSGLVHIGGPGSFWFSTKNVNIGGDAIASGGDARLTLAGGASVAAPQVTVFGPGWLNGNGTLTGGLVSGGNVAPGLSAGKLTVLMNYEQLESGALWIEIGGTEQGVDFDYLEIFGDAALDGRISIEFSDAFVPDIDDAFVFLTAAAVTGRFSDVLLPSIPGLDFGIVYGVDFVSVAVIAPVPLPPAIYVMACALLWLAFKSRRRVGMA